MVAVRIIFLVIGLLCAILCAVYIVICIGYRKSNTVKGKAFLEKTDCCRDVYIGRPAKHYPRFTDATYVYRVEGKAYRFSVHLGAKPSDFPQTVCVFYQKNRPWRSHITACPIVEPIVAMVAGMVAVLFILCAVMM